MARLLLVDLNNFAHYPSIAIGLLTAALREADHEVNVFSPLAHGVRSLPRESVETTLDHLERRISYSARGWLKRPRRMLGKVRGRWRSHREQRALPAFLHELGRGVDLVLISTYTDSRELVQRMCGAADAAGVPVVLGGPIFSQAPVSRTWTRLPGVRAIVGAEYTRKVSALCADLLAGVPLTPRPGLFLPGGPEEPPAPSERELDSLVFPDYTDFPWERYDRRVIPILMGRGCGWGRCRFCGDIVTANGRGYRARSVQRVLDEMREQSARHDSRDFVFLDLKLNSRPEEWRSLIRGVRDELPGSRWIGSVHVEEGVDNGLNLEDLRAARQAGMVRVTFGLESGSQRILDAMDKGTTVERNARFAREASSAGLSVRCTVIQGYPGERAEDLRATARSLDELRGDLERVSVNRLNVLEGTMLANDLERDESTELRDLAWEHDYARSSYTHHLDQDREYRQAVRELLRVVHEINARPIREEARAFHGLM